MTLEQTHVRFGAECKPVEVVQLQSDGWIGRTVVRVTEQSSGIMGVSRCPSEGDWRRWIKSSLTENAESARREYLKYSPSVEIFRDRISIGDSDGGIEVVCKKTKGVGFLGRLRASRAERNFRRGWMLLDAGIQTAVPLAAIERRERVRESCLVTRFVPDLMDLDRIAMLDLPRISGSRAVALKMTLVEQVAGLFARLRARRLHHRDMKASNIMVANANTPATASLFILDLDGLGAASRWRRGLRWQPLMRLAASLIGYRGVTRADFARCLRRYLVLTDGIDREWRNHYRRLSAEARSYSAASGQRKRGKLDGIG
ncbi:MAG: hypothetical protein HY287_14610 [Planctomycetes bacterium]|nr:hypothetical protein [Planctomycetota bacterium]MBI3835555.1 hypothetical protein [Planctomycetota bacterium]